MVGAITCPSTANRSMDRAFWTECALIGGLGHRGGEAKHRPNSAARKSKRALMNSLRFEAPGPIAILMGSLGEWCLTVLRLPPPPYLPHHIPETARSDPAPARPLRSCWKRPGT